MHPAADRATAGGWTDEPLPVLLTDVTINALLAGRDPVQDRRVALVFYRRARRRMMRAEINALLREINEALSPEEHCNG